MGVGFVLSSFQRQTGVCRKAGGPRGRVWGRSPESEQGALSAPHVRVLGGRRGGQCHLTTAHQAVSPMGPPPRTPGLFPCPEQPAYVYTLSTRTLSTHSLPTTQVLSDMNFQACIHIFGWFIHRTWSQEISRKGRCLHFHLIWPSWSNQLFSKLNCQDSPKIQLKGKQRKDFTYLQIYFRNKIY